MFNLVEECRQFFRTDEYSDDCESQACDQKFDNPRVVIKTLSCFLLYGKSDNFLIRFFLIYISYPIDIEERKTKRNAEMKESGSKFFIFVEEC